MEPLILERTYDAPIQRVWDALTDPAKMKQWYFPMMPDFEPRVGFETRFDVEHNGVVWPHVWKVTESDPITKIAYSWRYEGYPGNSEVRFQLEDKGRQTKLTLTHTFTEPFDTVRYPDTSRQNFTAGWTQFVDKLDAFVALGGFSLQVDIAAPVRIVWDVLLDPNGKWAMAFGGGALAETDWQEGHPVVWTDLQGNVGASGKIVRLEPGKELKMQYYDTLAPGASTKLGPYTETLTLEEKDGHTLLRGQVDNLEKAYHGQHVLMWEKALELIKTESEK